MVVIDGEDSEMEEEGEDGGGKRDEIGEFPDPM